MEMEIFLRVYIRGEEEGMVAWLPLKLDPTIRLETEIPAASQQQSNSSPQSIRTFSHRRRNGRRRRRRRKTTAACCLLLGCHQSDADFHHQRAHINRLDKTVSTAADVYKTAVVEVEAANVNVDDGCTAARWMAHRIISIRVHRPPPPFRLDSSLVYLYTYSWWWWWSVYNATLLYFVT